MTTVASDAPRPHAALSRDPADDYLLALARATEVEAIVSGDRDLLSILELVPPVLTPRELVERLRREP